MNSRMMRCVWLMLVVLFAIGCDVTRSLPEGSYLLSKVEFEEDKSTPREERITVDRDGIDIYVRQSPNKRILGMDGGGRMFHVSATGKERSAPDSQ